jgi:hypothetical protein
MWIMIAGPYSTGAANSEDLHQNHSALNEAALQIFEKGHIPIIGVNLALPIISIAGEDRFNEIMMPISLAIAERCDACLRIGGASAGADQEVDNFNQRGRVVFNNINEIPTA